MNYTNHKNDLCINHGLYITVSVTVVWLQETVLACKSRNVHELFKPEVLTHKNKTVQILAETRPMQGFGMPVGGLETEASSLCDCIL